jgi:hypothetical protein
LAQLRLWSKDQLNKEDKKNCFKWKMLYLFFSPSLFLSLCLLILQKRKQFWVKFFVLNKKKTDTTKENKQTKQTYKLK